MNSTASRRAIAVHGHFYQPPRENPWLEAIERQESARPYHDWNERITAECYAPNAAARILGEQGRIVRIVDNYERISFNVGPTLLNWLADEAPETYTAILDADRRSIERYGHGSAMAQVYNHMIMPLANARDRKTQALWGVRDFEHRFGRVPDGMWLPETAVDLATLESLAEAGIRFTVLAPYQAGRVREIGDEEWTDVGGGRVDTGRAYLQRLPSGREIALFFYDGPASRAVAFERLLDDGGRFAGRLIGLFDNAHDEEGDPRLVHIATDGESYGHHHHHGEMALAFALQTIDAGGDVELANYARWLALHPPEHEVEIVEDTSWSCAHGIERWRSDCGCQTGGRSEWTQAWRGPLREALDWLRDQLAPRWEAAAGEIFADPWAARDGYIDVVLDRSDANVERFLAAHARPGGPLAGIGGADSGRGADSDAVVRALQLLELQRHAMLMYTSCGWFFADLSGIETVQVIQYAGRAVQLAGTLFGEDLEAGFLDRLERPQSNLPDWGSGRDVYEHAVRPAMVDLRKVGAHYAVSSLFEAYDDTARIFCYEVARADERRREAGRTRFVVGRARVASTITRKSRDLVYAALHLGEHNVVGGVTDFAGEDGYATLAEELTDTFDRGDTTAVMRRLDEQFVARDYSLRSLFHDEQLKVVEAILEESIERAAEAYARVYDARVPLMRFIADLGIAAPRPFRMAAGFVLNSRLREELAADEPDLDAARRLVADARDERVELDATEIGHAVRRAIEHQAARVAEAPGEPGRLERLDELVAFAHELPLHVVFWGVQNAYWRLLQDPYPDLARRAADGDEEAAAWIEGFERLGERLSFDVAAAVEAATDHEKRPAVDADALADHPAVGAG